LKFLRTLLAWAAIAASGSPDAAARNLPLEPPVLARQLTATPAPVPALVSSVDPARLKLRSSSLSVLD